MDDAIGSVLTALDESGKLGETLVFFISDNGGPQDKNGSDNTPLSGDKGTVFEGGVRVPFVVQWQGRLPAGKKIDAPVNSLDIPATAAAAAGAKLGSNEKKIDGIDLIPYIKSEVQGYPHESLFWRFGTQRAIRQGDHKLRQQGDEPPQLFNLVNDIGETKDISSEHPELVKKLNAAYTKWNSELAEPLWKTGKSSGKNSARASRRAARENAGERTRKRSTIANQ